MPFKEIFDKVGLSFSAKIQREVYTLGGIGIGINPKNDRVIVYDVSEINEFGKKMKFKEADEIIEFNGETLTPENAQKILIPYTEKVKEGEKLMVKVIRRNKKGKEKTLTLKSKQQKISYDVYNYLEVNAEATSRQILARNAWLGISGD